MTNVRKISQYNVIVYNEETKNIDTMDVIPYIVAEFQKLRCHFKTKDEIIGMVVYIGKKLFEKNPRFEWCLCPYPYKSWVQNVDKWRSEASTETVLEAAIAVEKMQLSDLIRISVWEQMQQNIGVIANILSVRYLTNNLRRKWGGGYKFKYEDLIGEQTDELNPELKCVTKRIRKKKPKK